MLSNYYSYSPSHVSIPYSYRYGFNGQERELQLNQSVTSAEYWFYDGRLGRRWNVEPLIHNYAFISSYACFNNNPISYVDFLGNEPCEQNAIGLSAYISNLRENEIKTLAQLQSIHGGIIGRSASSNSSGARGSSGSGVGSSGTKAQPRYLYSSKWGWIDMRHFSSGAALTDNPLLTGHSILSHGENNELEQELANDPSAWDYEDLISNLLGVYFETYLESDVAKGKDLITNLQNYLSELGFVESPLTEKPLENTILPNNHGDTGEQNYTYTPKYAKYERNGELDNKIMTYLNKYMKGKNQDRRAEKTKAYNDRAKKAATKGRHID